MKVHPDAANSPDNSDNETPNSNFVDNFNHRESQQLYDMLGPGLSKVDIKAKDVTGLLAVYKPRSGVKFPAYSKYIMARKAALLTKAQSDKPFMGAKKRKVRKPDYLE